MAARKPLKGAPPEAGEKYPGPKHPQEHRAPSGGFARKKASGQGGQSPGGAPPGVFPPEPPRANRAGNKRKRWGGPARSFVQWAFR